ncbi:hypothetical protein C8Q80DRAFT_447200 [Daedaleopsis nitida]|nr:hypothetical protein C8Q80DRAFT_447200 [Daedaleopsis nitida]
MSLVYDICIEVALIVVVVGIAMYVYWRRRKSAKESENSYAVLLDERAVLLQRVHAGPGERHLGERALGNAALQPVPDPAATRRPGRKRCQPFQDRRRSPRIRARREVGPVTDLAPSLCRYTTTSRMTSLDPHDAHVYLFLLAPRTSLLARAGVDATRALTLTRGCPARRRLITLLIRRRRASRSRRFAACIYPRNPTRRPISEMPRTCYRSSASGPPRVDARRGGS